MVRRVYSGGVRRSRMSTAMTPESLDPGSGTTVTTQDGIGAAVSTGAAALAWALWQAVASATSTRTATTKRRTGRPRLGDDIGFSPLELTMPRPYPAGWTWRPHVCVA